MKAVKTTEANADALLAIIDKSYGYPSRPASMADGSRLHPSIALSWDGKDPAPSGWTVTQYEIYRTSAADCLLPIEDVTASRVAAGVASAPEKAALAAVLSSRTEVEDLSEGGKRTVKKREASSKTEAVSK